MKPTIVVGLKDPAGNTWLRLPVYQEVALWKCSICEEVYEDEYRAEQCCTWGCPVRDCDYVQEIALKAKWQEHLLNEHPETSYARNIREYNEAKEKGLLP